MRDETMKIVMDMLMNDVNVLMTKLKNAEPMLVLVNIDSRLVVTENLTHRVREQ